jgi:hypothetical protein
MKGILIKREVFLSEFLKNDRKTFVKRLVSGRSMELLENINITKLVQIFYF